MTVTENSDTGVVNPLLNAIEGMIAKFIEKIVPRPKVYAPLLQFSDTAILQANGTVGFAVAYLRGPTKGRFWYVRNIRTSGITPSTAVANTRADIFIGPQDLRGAANLAACPIAFWKDQMPTVPLVNIYSHGAIRVGPQESVYVVFSGTGTNGLQVNAALDAYEYPDTDENIEWVT